MISPIFDLLLFWKKPFEWETFVFLAKMTILPTFPLILFIRVKVKKTPSVPGTKTYNRK